MNRKKPVVLAWITAILAIISVIMLLAAAIFAVINLEIISNECSNWHGEKPVFDVAITIAGTAFGIQILAIILAVVVTAIQKSSTKTKKQEVAV